MTTKEGDSKRLEAAKLFAQGYGYKAVSTELGINRETVRDWSYTWRALGTEGLHYLPTIKLAAVHDRQNGLGVVEVMEGWHGRVMSVGEYSAKVIVDLYECIGTPTILLTHKDLKLFNSFRDVYLTLALVEGLVERGIKLSEACGYIENYSSQNYSCWVPEKYCWYLFKD